MENNIRMRKFDFRCDLVEIFELMMQAEDQALFLGRVQINSLPDFEKWMIHNMSMYYHDFYVLQDTQTYKVVGYVYSYDYRLYDLHCKVSIFLKPEYRNVGIGALAGIRFLNELFTSFPLRKIYADVYDYNKQSLQSNLGAGFEEEGVLKEYRFNAGKYYDMHMLSITRERFYEKFGSMFKKND